MPHDAIQAQGRSERCPDGEIPLLGHQEGNKRVDMGSGSSHDSIQHQKQAKEGILQQKNTLQQL